MVKKITGSDDDDTIVAQDTSDIFTFGGNDKVTLELAADFSFVDTGDGNDHVISQVQRGSEIHLGAGNDTFTPDIRDFSAVGDMVLGEDGNDRFGIAGLNSSFLGGAGKDVFEFQVAGRSNDVNGGFGKDTLSFEVVSAGSLGEITINLKFGTAQFENSGIDTISRVENIIGTAAGDVIIGDEGNNTLNGIGGFDELEGGAGKDRLVGGALSDKLTGDEGADRFVFLGVQDSIGSFGSRDRIFDFSQDENDRIDLSAIDANVNKGGDQAFKFIGIGAFSGKAGELRFDGDVVQGDDTNTVFADVDGDGDADMAFDVNLTNFVSGDFIL